jgi:hypothetical protein
MDILATKEDILLLNEDLANFRRDIIRWMFLLWLGQIAVVIVLKLKLL